MKQVQVKARLVRREQDDPDQGFCDPAVQAAKVAAKREQS